MQNTTLLTNEELDKILIADAYNIPIQEITRDEVTGRYYCKGTIQNKLRLGLVGAPA